MNKRSFLYNVEVDKDQAIVRKAEKLLPYTVIPVGDKAAYRAWKPLHAKKEALYDQKNIELRELRRQQAILMVQEQLSTVSLTKQEKAEIQYQYKRNKKVISEVRQYLKLEEPPVIVPLKTKIIAWFSRVWEAAFRAE